MELHTPSIATGVVGSRGSSTQLSLASVWTQSQLQERFQMCVCYTLQKCCWVVAHCTVSSQLCGHQSGWGPHHQLGVVTAGLAQLPGSNALLRPAAKGFHCALILDPGVSLWCRSRSHQAHCSLGAVPKVVNPLGSRAPGGNGGAVRLLGPLVTLEDFWLSPRSSSWCSGSEGAVVRLLRWWCAAGVAAAQVPSEKQLEKVQGAVQPTAPLPWLVTLLLGDRQPRGGRGMSGVQQENVELANTPPSPHWLILTGYGVVPVKANREGSTAFIQGLNCTSK